MHLTGLNTYCSINHRFRMLDNVKVFEAGFGAGAFWWKYLTYYWPLLYNTFTNGASTYQLKDLCAESEPWIIHAKGVQHLQSMLIFLEQVHSMAISTLLLVLTTLNLHRWYILWYLCTRQTWMLQMNHMFLMLGEVKIFSTINFLGQLPFKYHI